MSSPLAFSISSAYHTIPNPVASDFQQSAERDALTSQNAFILVNDSLVLAEEVADFCRLHPGPSRNVSVRSDVSVQLSHECLAESHYFCVGFAVRIEVRTALAAADRKSSQTVLEDLFES